MVLPHRLADDVATPHATSISYLLSPRKSNADKSGMRLSSESLTFLIHYRFLP